MKISIAEGIPSVNIRNQIKSNQIKSNQIKSKIVAKSQNSLKLPDLHPVVGFSYPLLHRHVLGLTQAPCRHDGLLQIAEDDKYDFSICQNRDYSQFLKA